MILQANAMKIPLADESVDMCVTSPPYWGLRDYSVANQLGLESTPEEYVENMVQVFREVWRVLKPEGTLWLNLGDSYNGSGGAGGDYNDGGLKEGQPKYKGRNVSHLKPKDLVGIPWRVAFALQADGWWLRSDIIWHKPNPMPESVTDRPTKAHEYVFLLTKSARYYYDADAVREPLSEISLSQVKLANKGAFIENTNAKKTYNVQGSGNFGEKGPGAAHRGAAMNPAGRNRRTVWTVTTAPYKGAHFATYPPKLIEPCILAGCPAGGIVLDPFFGSGTTGEVAIKHGRRFVGLDLSMEYIRLAKKRTSNINVMLPLGVEG